MYSVWVGFWDLFGMAFGWTLPMLRRFSMWFVYRNARRKWWMP